MDETIGTTMETFEMDIGSLTDGGCFEDSSSVGEDFSGGGDDPGLSTDIV